MDEPHKTTEEIVDEIFGGESQAAEPASRGARRRRRRRTQALPPWVPRLGI